MKIPKLLLQTMLVAVTTGTLCSCEKQKLEKNQTPVIKKQVQTNNNPGSWIACGMG